jgi:hypothetical protein
MTVTAFHYIDKNKNVIKTKSEVKVTYVTDTLTKDSIIIREEVVRKDSFVYHRIKTTDTLIDSVFSDGQPYLDTHSHKMKMKIRGTNKRVKRNDDIIISPQHEIELKK